MKNERNLLFWNDEKCARPGHLFVCHHNDEPRTISRRNTDIDIDTDSMRVFTVILVLVLSIFLNGLQEAESFTSIRISPNPWVGVNRHHHRRAGTNVRSSNRDEEIANLEQQLQKLKEQPEEDSSELEPPPVEASSSFTFPGEKAMAPGKGEDFFFTEGDLDSQGILEETTEKGGPGLLPMIGLVVAAIVALGIFSQVPVGQEDFTRYSSTPTTSTRIDLGDLNEGRTGTAP
eukprot:scaffold180528_cov53-Attheya_sp.AAC.5